jgi:hypothetical protein
MPHSPKRRRAEEEANDSCCRRGAAEPSAGDSRRHKAASSSPTPTTNVALKKQRRRDDKKKASRLRRRLAESESSSSSAMSLSFLAEQAAAAAESVAALINAQANQRNARHGNNDATAAAAGSGDPLLIASMRNTFTYESLAFMIRQINFDSAASKSVSAPPCASTSSEGASPKVAPADDAPVARERRMSLTPELMRRVAGYLTVRPVQQSDVRVVGCSSHDRRHPLESCLTPADSTWWISGPQTMIHGRGREYVEFRLCPAGYRESCRRLSSFSLRIPPLPMGPLSVREFELQGRVERFHAAGVTTDTSSSSSSFSYRTLALTTPSAVQNVSGWQDFVLQEPADVSVVRIVCLSNQISRFMEDAANANSTSGPILPLVATPFDQVGFYSIRFA